MGIRFDVNWRIKVNGKEYNAPGQMPAGVREAYEKARKGPSDSRDGVVCRATTTRIVFNGREYERVDAMPPEARAMYRGIMEAVERGDGSVAEIPGIGTGRTAIHTVAGAPPLSARALRRIAPESFSARKLVVGAAIVALFAGLHFLARR